MYSAMRAERGDAWVKRPVRPVGLPGVRYLAVDVVLVVVLLAARVVVEIEAELAALELAVLLLLLPMMVLARTGRERRMVELGLEGASV